MQITAITTEYDPQEDRLCLDIADAQGSTGRRWLTYRLLTRLLPTLLKQAQQQIAAAPDTPVAAQQAANIYAQLQARITKKPAAPVQVDHSATGQLIHEINLSLPKAGGATLHLRTAQPVADTLKLTSQELRQWLEALRHACRQADWPSEMWPDWLQPASTRSVPSQN